ncbi:MAG: M3 family oligoendopeptidase [Chloroflexi bacterium]|nr:M3 family oligoendopeptidase [Chloroflexota bacterium]
MVFKLPASVESLMQMTWPQFEPCYQTLNATVLTSDNVNGWLADWTHMSELINEIHQRLYVATTINTSDAVAERCYTHFLDDIYPSVQAAEQKLREKLLASYLEPSGFEVPLRNMRAQAALYCDENVPLLAEEHKLEMAYDKIIGAQTVAWGGKEITITQLRPVFQDNDRHLRERAWRLIAQRQLANHDVINALWVKFMELRRRLAENAGYPDYRAFRWQQLLRFDYTPRDCGQFHDAIEQVVVPAAERIYERRRRRLGVSSLRPWDLEVDALGRPALRPFATVEELEQKVEVMFRRVDPQLACYFATMRQERLLDLDNRKDKAPGGYCTSFAVVKRPFIFMNAVGLHDDVQTLLHEGGHAFHVFESAHLPYYHQLEVGMEFAEVASMSMELLSAPYLPSEQGGFYSEADAARARVEHLEGIITFWPYMAVVDAFQHWAYENHEAAMAPANCDAKWAELWRRFMRGVDWSGLEQEMMTGWHRKLHIHQVPFYYVEYGMAQLGAVQVWRQSLENQAAAVCRYRDALSLGGTATLPELYAAAGARFAFDTSALRDAVTLVEQTIERLDTA